MTSERRIDIHQHFIPSFWADELPAHGGDPSGSSMPAWSVDAALGFMDGFGIDHAVLSMTTPGVNGWKGGALVDMAKRINDFGADIVARHPDRFGLLAIMPIPDVDATVVEIGRSLDELGADGIVLMSSVNGLYAGDAAMEAVWAELDKRAAVVFIHPSMPQVSPATGVAGPLVDFPYDTTRAAVQLVLNGVMDRFREAKVILAHAGGFLPYGAPRFAQLAGGFDKDAISPEDAMAAFKRFYFDTAITGFEPTIDALVELASADRILYGSDFPYAKPPLVKSFTDHLGSAGLDAATAKGIASGNAENLFPGLGKR